MKLMKHVTHLLAVCILAIACVFGCTACVDSDDLVGSMTLVLTSDKGTKVYTVDLDDFETDDSVADVILELADEDDSDFYFVGKSSKYGLYLTEVGYTTKTGEYETYNPIAKEDAATSTYLFVYTDITDQFNNEWGTITYSGTTYGSAIVGISSLPLENGKTVVISQQTWG